MLRHSGAPLDAHFLLKEDFENFPPPLHFIKTFNALTRKCKNIFLAFCKKNLTSKNISSFSFWPQFSPGTKILSFFGHCQGKKTTKKQNLCQNKKKPANASTQKDTTHMHTQPSKPSSPFISKFLLPKNKVFFSTLSMT